MLSNIIGAISDIFQIQQYCLRYNFALHIHRSNDDPWIQNE